MTLDYFDTILVIVPPDDALSRDVERFLHDLDDRFDFLNAVIAARFAVIRASLQMTREVIANG